jgi:hypothetical protein
MLIDTPQGIVLRTYVPQKQKLSVLDANRGRIDCVPQDTRAAHQLTTGAYMTYGIRPWHAYYIVYDTDIVDMPLYWAHENLLFFHHVLELCYYFLPVDNIVEDIFILVKKLYTSPKIIQTDLSKKIFLCQFFICLGIYPADARSYGSSFFSLISGPFDSKVNAHGELHMQLQRWLLTCISTHPYAHTLKTIGFLRKTDIHDE